jgi:hypothetical protein
MATRITQKTLAAILKRRAALAKAEEELQAIEAGLLTKLKAGAQVQVGTFRAEVKVWERRSVAWKEVVVKKLGQEYADRVFNATPPETYEKLVVETVG